MHCSHSYKQYHHDIDLNSSLHPGTFSETGKAWLRYLTQPFHDFVIMELCYKKSHF